MSLSENLKIQADKYLDNSMSKQERTAFELELASNEALQHYVTINQEMQVQFNDTDWQFVEASKSNQTEALKSYFKSEDAKQLKSTLKKVASNYKDETIVKTSSKTKLYSFFAVAASIVLLVGFFLFNSDKNLYNDYNSWEELPSLIERGVEQNSILQEAENAFVNKDYVKANQLYSQFVTETKTTNPNVYLYLGITQLELNQNKKALSTFDKLVTSNSLDASKGYWYKALTYLKAEDKVSAIKELEVIVSSTKNYKFTEAKTLLEKLKN